jgi:hypothetical protein
VTAGAGTVTNVTEIREIFGKNLDLDLEVLPPGRKPRPGPDLDRGEDPDGLFFVVDDRTNLICLKFCDGDSIDLSIVETAKCGISSSVTSNSSHRSVSLDDTLGSVACTT